MAHFLELHIKHSGEPIYINTNSIAYVEKSNGCVLFILCITELQALAMRMFFQVIVKR